ncbi:phage head closure protein [Brucella sp. C7-11G]
MAKATGSLFHEVAFDRRKATGGDGAGNIDGDWVEQFRCRAEFIQLRGGEAVLAGRLQGRHTQVIRIRVSEHSVVITADWQVRDIRRGTAFNIRDIEFEENRQFISLTCESGVATG